MKNKKTKNNFKQKIKNFFKIPDEVFEEEESPNFKREKFFTLTRTNIFIGLALFLLIINLIIFTNLDFLYLRQILGFLFLVSFPGLILMLCFKIRDIGFWEYLVYTVGLSISFIMFAGLILNWTLPWMGITDKPLSLYPILICFNIFLIVLGIVAYKRNKDFKPKPFGVPKLDRLNNIMFTIPLVFPVLAILGAFLLNNHGPNILTMIMLGGIAVYVLLLTIFRKRLDKNIWLWAIFMIAISILFASSLRSWFVSGVDTNTELSILNSIIKTRVWSPEIFGGAYGSMLALTILPSILHNISSIDPNFIMKFGEVFIYALVPVTFYLLFKDKNRIIAFFAAFFFMSTPIFIDWWPVPIRQQFAFLFFGLMLLIIFREKINLVNRKELFIIFGFSMAVSHYSTTYIALAIFALSYIFMFIQKKYSSRKIKKKNTYSKQKRIFLLSLGIILILLLFSFLWYNQSTDTSSGLEYFVKTSFSNLGDLFNEDLQAPGSSFAEQFSIKSKQTLPEVLNEYVRDFENKSQIDPSSRVNGFNLNTKIPQGNKLSTLGKIPLALSMRSLFEVITKVLFGIGFIVFLFSMKKLHFSKEKKSVILISYVLIGIVAILPLISINYDLSRTFAQSLFLSAFFSIAGLYFLFSLFRSKKTIIFVSIFLVLYFLVFSGFYMQLAGGSDIPLNLNNKGINYVKFYTHEADVAGADWMFSNSENNAMISDSHGFGKAILAKSYERKTRYYQTVSLIRKTNAPIYTRYSNTFSDVGTSFYRNIVLYYDFPDRFLNDNKNKVYSNGGSEVFK